MAKKNKNKEELIDEEIIYEEETGQQGSGQSAEEGSFFDKYKNFIFGGAALIAVGIIVWVYMGRQQDKNNEVAQASMTRAIQYFEADSIRLALNGDGQNDGFLTIAEDFGGTNAGNLAKYYTGVCYMKIGQNEIGLDYLKEFKKGDDMLSATAYAALGYGYEESGDFEKAAQEYEKASRTPEENEYTTPFYLMDAARCYDTAGETDKALGIYEKIKKKYPLSEEGQQVDKYIARLGGNV